MKKRGRIIINTGDGKGKTTAALGTALRALGHGHRVCVIQFLKGTGIAGEQLMAPQLENLEWHICGKGFIFNREDTEEDKKAALEGFELAREKVASNQFDLIILDEITYLHWYNFLSVEEMVSLLDHKPDRLSIILTGRNAPPQLVEKADTVTEMGSIKHGFTSGIKAQKGIEF
ncbi:MAG: cob(I)yrinic acid a,c-diamide adenosyltransferase [Desulfobacterales bacterium]|nr:MAG: cob(I)yrinic acid a,c-diamide adenosyltransferase [Desulfobacterales bacterium]